jgi:hypothetical protein
MAIPLVFCLALITLTGGAWWLQRTRAETARLAALDRWAEKELSKQADTAKPQGEHP